MDSDRSVGDESSVDGGAVRRVRRIIGVAASLALAACATQMGPIGGFRSPSDPASIKAMFDSTAAGWNRGELPVYLSAYVDSATAMGSTGLVRGVAGIEGQMRGGFWRTGHPLQNLSYDHLEIRPIGPDQAIATGQYILTGGGRPDRTGWFSTIWVRTAKGWRMVHDHSS